MRTERIEIGARLLTIARPESPESLIDEERFEQDEFLPYWAELWPSGIALARYVATLDLHGQRALELGCGLALPSFAAALAGADVLATDWAPEALELAAANAAANGLRVRTALLDWSRPVDAGGGAGFDLVLAADVLYEERNAEPLLAVLDAALADRGEVLLADPGRRHAGRFLEAAREACWSVGVVSAPGIPAGWIAVLRRHGSPATG